MYYEPTFFKPQEIFSKDIWDREKEKGNQIWRLMDGRILWTADQIRMHFCGKSIQHSVDTMTINNWYFGGQRQYSGYRDIYVDIISANNRFSVTSQHVFGRAIDYVFKKTSAEEVIKDILDNQTADRYKFITGLEIKTSWTHNDTRSWNKEASGILTFKR